MCKECGCGEHHHHHGDGVHAHTGADGKVYYHSHETAPREVSLGQAILAKNDGVAELNRAFFAWQRNPDLQFDFVPGFR